MSPRLRPEAAAADVSLPDAQRAPLRLRLAAQIRADWLAVRPPAANAGGFLDDHDTPEGAVDFLHAHPLFPRLSELAPQGSELDRLGAGLGLSAPELDVIDALLALAADPGLAGPLAALSPHGRGVVTAPAVARLFGHGRTLILTESSGLRLWDLVEEQPLTPGEPAALALDPAILARLCGRPAPEPALGPLLVEDEAWPALAEWPVEAVAREAAANLRGAAPRPVRVIVRGEPGLGRTTFARAVAAAVGLPLLAFDADAAGDAAWPGLHRLANRMAFLEEAAIAWRGAAFPHRPRPGRHPVFPLEFLALAPNAPAPARPGGPVPALIEVQLQAPGPEARRGLWLTHAPSAASWPPAELERLCAYEVRPAEIAAVAHRRLPDAEACIHALRANLPDELRDFAELPECGFRWDDLVVAEPVRAALEEFAFEARSRAAVWREAEPRRLFPQGRALVGLFSGAPGTGKTMAAQVIAAELGLTLCRVNLATITSKWVGETSQRVDALFRFCAGRNTLLLIDEADALCGKRIEEAADAQDAHVNRDISHLMMAIESHDGAVVLTTNLRGNIDPAFIRRLRHSVEFRKPVLEERLALWTKLIGGLCGPSAVADLEARLRPLAGIEATGAQIKNAVLSARFSALRDDGAVTLPHLAAGLDREFRKEGYGLSPGQIAEAIHG